MRNPGMKRWTREQELLLEAAVEAHGTHDWDKVFTARVPGRSASQCQSKYLYGAHNMSRIGDQTQGAAERRAPAHVLADRARRAELALQPRSTTAEFFGDPLPGRSALDQKAAEAERETDRVLFSSVGGGRPMPTPSLATAPFRTD